MLALVGLLWARGAFVRGMTGRCGGGDGEEATGEERLRGMLGGGIVDAIDNKLYTGRV